MELPARVGEFELTDVLGEGGTGAVYGGTKDGVPVAVKVLRADLALTEKETRRFFDEAAKMRRVTHRAIVPVLEAGTLPDGRPYLSMPRLEGETLAARLTRGPLPREQALRVFAELADAVITLHDAGLVHRDIKPENVLLAQPDGRAVLLDLGIAREVDGARSTTTMEGRTRGTPAYMAPERFFGAAATIQSDVYELAVLLYAMLTGRLPWSEDGPAGRLTPVPPEEAGTPMSPALSTSILRALSTRVEVRPTSVRAFSDEIARAAAAPMDSTATPARTTAPVDVFAATATPATVPPPPAPRRRPALVIAGVVALAGAASVAAIFARPSPAPPAPASPASTPPPVAAPKSAPAIDPALASTSVKSALAEVPSASSAPPTQRAPAASSSASRKGVPPKTARPTASNPEEFYEYRR